MIRKNELLNFILKKNLFAYDSERNILINKEGFEINLDLFYEEYKKETGQSFECIYEEHISCFNLIKCTECNTIVFEYYDEDYDPNLKCPTCTDYKTHFKYYTKEDIERDPGKQKEIDMYIELDKLDREREARYIKRGNLNDWEKTHIHTIFSNNKYRIDVQLIGYSKWDLKAHFVVWKKHQESQYLVWGNSITIPVSPRAIYSSIKQKVIRKPVTTES